MRASRRVGFVVDLDDGLRRGLQSDADRVESEQDLGRRHAIDYPAARSRSGTMRPASIVMRRWQRGAMAVSCVTSTSVVPRSR